MKNIDSSLEENKNLSVSFDFYEYLDKLKKEEGDVLDNSLDIKKFEQEKIQKNKTKLQQKYLDLIKLHSKNNDSIKCLSIMNIIYPEKYLEINNDILYLYSKEVDKIDHIKNIQEPNNIKLFRLKIISSDINFNVTLMEKSYFSNNIRNLKLKRTSDNLPQCISSIIKFFNYKKNSEGLFKINPNMQNNIFLKDYPISAPYIYMYVKIENVIYCNVPLEKLSYEDFKKKV